MLKQKGDACEEFMSHRRKCQAERKPSFFALLGIICAPRPLNSFWWAGGEAADLVALCSQSTKGYFPGLAPEIQCKYCSLMKLQGTLQSKAGKSRVTDRSGETISRDQQ